MKPTQNEIIDKLKTTITLLANALEEARDHLEYTGYGDAWEREAAEGLPETIDAALLAAGRRAGK